MSVPWTMIDHVISQIGPVDGRIVIDTTNQFGPSGVIDLGGRTAASYNAARLLGARYTKSFNTLTAAFQEYRQADTQAVLDALRAERPIPPTPIY